MEAEEPTIQPPSGDAPNFGQSPDEERPSRIPMAIGAAVILLAIAALIVGGKLSRGPVAPGPDPYVKNLQLTDAKLSQAENFVGGNVTYLEGKITNAGQKTVNGATVRVVFKNS